jgi:hypothetical protein
VGSHSIILPSGYVTPRAPEWRLEKRGPCRADHAEGDRPSTSCTATVSASAMISLAVSRPATRSVTSTNSAKPGIMCSEARRSDPAGPSLGAARG